MEPWEDAWLNGGKMPPYEFPRELLPTALDIADEWARDGRFRCILEEWVPRQRAGVELVYLLYNGFHLRGQTDRRERPIPVLTQVLYTIPHPANLAELRARMRELFAGVVQEWCRARERFGDDLEGAP
jgi:hypothetical protein